MADPDLRTLADTAGVIVDWTDADGVAQRVGDDTLVAVLDALGIHARTPAKCREAQAELNARSTQAPPLVTARAGEPVALGRAGGRVELVHEDGDRVELRVAEDGTVPAPPQPGEWKFGDDDERSLVVAPARCFGVADALGAAAPRAWGVALQVYSARGPRDAGIGDAGGADAWLTRAARYGAHAVALSPLHAAMPAGPHYSPYSPADRRWLDPLHADPAAVLGVAAAQSCLERAGLAGRFDALAAGALVDWPEGAAVKWRWLRALHAAHAGSHADAIAGFAAAGGDALHAHTQWAARAFGDGDPSLHVFAQWLAARSWAALQAQARGQGMGIGLVADLAVGFDPAGSEAAAQADAVLDGLLLGAPPDAFNAQGQVWGLGAYAPAALRRSGYAPFRTLLDCVMRDRGGVRIDHILGLKRMWLVPAGAEATHGAYLRYPMRELMDLLALASWRHRAIVIGEDLGVVPPGFRQRLAARGLLGMDVLPFTRDDDGGFLPPAQWRHDAVAMTTTHDLPTLTGWRIGRDLSWRRRCGLLDADGRRRAMRERRTDVAALDRAIVAAGGTTDGDPTVAALRHVATTPSPLVLVPAEDMLGLRGQPNLPGVVETHPNWRRRLPEQAGTAWDAAVAAIGDGRRQAATP